MNKRIAFYLAALILLAAFITFEIATIWFPKVEHHYEESIFVYDRKNNTLYVSKFGVSAEDPVTWQDIYRVLVMVNATDYTTIVIGNRIVVGSEP